MWKTIFTIDTWHKDYHKTVNQIRTKWSTVFLCSHLYGMIKEIKKQDRRGRMEHNLLSLDFWQDTVTYEGHSMPTGTIGCAALNTPDAVIEKLDVLCAPINRFMKTLTDSAPILPYCPRRKKRQYRF